MGNPVSHQAVEETSEPKTFPSPGGEIGERSGEMSEPPGRKSRGYKDYPEETGEEANSRLSNRPQIACSLLSSATTASVSCQHRR